MSALEDDRPRHLVTEWNDGLLAIPFKENGRWKVRYEILPRTVHRDVGMQPAAEGVATGDETKLESISASKQAVLDLFGAWSHLDEDEMIAALERIRHDSAPTPPIEVDDEDA